ncbi:MAG: universal stress protein [Planctomycetes bacterium]|nr:universal stress protein [Planctomycetota bacterium]
MFKNILVPLDGSETAEHALPYAEHLARSLNSEVVLFAACESDRMERLFNAYLAQKTEELGTEWVRAHSVVVHDSPAHAILHFAEENSIGLIAMCTHGTSGPGIWALGSIAAKVMQQSTTPILLIRSEETQSATALRAFQKILVPLDGSSLAEGVIPYVEHLARALGSQVFPIRIVDRLKSPPVPVADYAAGLALKEYEKDLADMMIKEAATYLTEKESELQNKGIDASSSVLMGKPHKFITEYARENAGLIALTTHGHTGDRKGAYGSITSKILETSSQPVLLVRPLLPD